MNKGHRKEKLTKHSIIKVRNLKRMTIAKRYALSLALETRDSPIAQLVRALH